MGRHSFQGAPPSVLLHFVILRWIDCVYKTLDPCRCLYVCGDPPQGRRVCCLKTGRRPKEPPLGAILFQNVWWIVSVFESGFVCVSLGCWSIYSEFSHALFVLYIPNHFWIFLVVRDSERFYVFCRETSHNELVNAIFLKIELWILLNY